MSVPIVRLTRLAGGLSVACAPDKPDAILKTIVDAGYSLACIIGRAEIRTACVVV